MTACPQRAGEFRLLPGQRRPPPGLPGLSALHPPGPERRPAGAEGDISGIRYHRAADDRPVQLSYGGGRLLANGDVQRAHVVLYGTFAQTGRGHGTDRAITAGLLGLEPDDERLRDSFEMARSAGMKIEIVCSELGAAHPNSARITVTDSRGRSVEMAGASIGGGRIEVQQINGLVSSSLFLDTLSTYFDIVLAYSAGGIFSWV